MPDSFRIDVHHHILPPRYVQAVGAEAIGALLVSGKLPEWSPEISLDAMDRNGIQKAFTSMSAPGLVGLDESELADAARNFNDYAAAMCRDHPDRFGSFSCLPLPRVDLSIREIDRVYDDIGTDGVCLLTSYAGKLLGDPSFESVFASLNERRAVAFVHPVSGSCSCEISGVPAATLEFVFDTTRAIVSLMMSGIFQRYPNIRFIFSHAGGTVPFIAERLSRLERIPGNRAALQSGVIQILRRQYYDTALSANEYVFATLLKFVDTSQVLFGSDFPFAPEDTLTASIQGLEKLRLPNAERFAIERGNAQSLLPCQ